MDDKKGHFEAGELEKLISWQEVTFACCEGGGGVQNRSEIWTVTVDMYNPLKMFANRKESV
jgi:hypothetical protein